MSIQAFGEASSFVGSHTTTPIGPMLWLLGMAVMMPGRIAALAFVEGGWWVGRASRTQDALVMAVIEILVNALVWMAFAKLFRAMKRRR